VKRAIVSDIHANLEALEAVLRDIETQKVDKIYCLGDVVGYGPNPLECIDRALEFDLSILGNHDQGAVYDPEGFSSGAERAIFWTRQQLENGGADGQNVKRVNYLCEMQRSQREDGYLFVHGSARSPLSEYVFPEDTYNARKIEKIFTYIEHISFQGHTHVPGVFTADSRFFHPKDIDYRYVLGEGKTMINVGSVGQPRDLDPRSCYVVLDDNVVYYRRVEYRFEETIKKIYAIPDLDNFLGDRLREGR
jgi:predicted phosphodiesterase